MFSTFYYIKSQLKNKFVANPIQNAIIYLSPVILYLIAWIAGGHLVEKDKSEKIVNNEFMYIVAVTVLLYLVLSYTSAYDLIREKALYRKQYMYTYGFHLIRFYLAWVIIYTLLILTTSLIISICVYFSKIIPNVHFCIIFGSFFAYELTVVMLPFWFAAYFSKPKVGALFCFLCNVAISVGHVIAIYFICYRGTDDEIENNSYSGYVSNILYIMNLAEHGGQFINFSNIFNKEYINIFIFSCSNLGTVLLCILLGIFSDYLIISGHIKKHWYERRRQSKYRSFIPSKSTSKSSSKKISKKDSKLSNTNSLENNSDSDSEAELNGKKNSHNEKKRGWHKFLSFRKTRNQKKTCNKDDDSMETESDFTESSSNFSLYPKDSEDIAVTGENLFKQYSSDGGLILQNVTFKAYKNEVLVILGRHYAGKSTLMQILYGRQHASYGHVKIYGKELDYNKWDSVTGKLSVAPREDYVFFKDLTVADHIQLYESLISFKDMNQDHGYNLLKEFGFTRDLNTPIKDLTKEERIKLKIVLALLKPTKILLLEEPVDYLSPEDRILFWRMINKRRSRKTIIISTSDESDDTLSMADRILVLDHHQIQCIGDSNEILKYLQSRS